MRIRSAFFTGILICISVLADAQNLITSYSVEEGLPQSTVMALYRDNDGYLWCGTGSGLGVYDGWEFHTPVTDKEKANPDLNSPVRGIVPSSDGKSIWVGTESVIMQFDRFNYHVMRSYDVVKKPGIAEIPVMANDTAVWVICWANGLYRVRISDGKITQLTNDSFVDQHGLSADKQTIVFPDTTNHFVIYNLLTDQVRKVTRPEGMRGVIIAGCHTLPDSPAKLLVLTRHGLWTIDLTDGSFEPFTLGDPSFDDKNTDFRCMDIHPDGSWWMTAMDKGIYRYDPAAKKIRPCFWQQDGTNVSALMSAPKTLVCDAYGVVWLGTDGAGLIKMLNNRVTFRSKFTSPVVTDTCNWFIRSFYELSPGRFLTGTYRNGLRLIDEHTGSITNVTLNNPVWTLQTPLFITESGDGRLVIGTETAVLLLDTVTWQTQEAKPYIEKDDQRYVGYLRLQSGKLLVYGNTGMHELLAGKTPAISAPIGEMANFTSGIQLHDGRILAASYYNGIEELTPEGKFVRYYTYENDIGVAKSTLVHGMIEDGDGNVWVGTQSGLLKLDKNCRLLETITTDQGLADNTIYDLTLINQTLVVATGHGVTMLDLTSYAMLSYTGADGLPSEECNTGALLYSASKELYIGTTSGFVHWNPSQTGNYFRPASILVSFGEGETESHGIVRESIIRDYGGGSIDLRIWLSDFSFPERAIYKYRLDGAGQELTTERGLRKLTYAALGSGFYSLLCSVNNPGSGELAMQKLLTIKIVPPFWMSGWFIAISSLAGILIITVVLFVMMRMNYQRKLRKLRMQQELDKVRARISRDIHDEIGAGLTRIALSGELMSVKASGDTQQQEKLKWIAGTARELSQSMKEVVWSVNPHYDSLDHMVAYFRSYVSGVAENADLRFRFVADNNNTPSIPVNPEMRRNLLLILKEAVSNSVKYSGCTELKLRVSWDGATFIVEISDNGCGFDLNSENKVNSNGVRNIRQRAEASGCVLRFTSEPGKGTSVEVSGPITPKE